MSWLPQINNRSFDARPPRYRDLEAQPNDVVDRMNGVVNLVLEAQKVEPSTDKSNPIRDVAVLLKYGLTYGEMIAVCAGIEGELPDGGPKADALAKKLNKWSADYLKITP